MAKNGQYAMSYSQLESLANELYRENQTLKNNTKEIDWAFDILKNEKFFSEDLVKHFAAKLEKLFTAVMEEDKNAEQKADTDTDKQ